MDEMDEIVHDDGSDESSQDDIGKPLQDYPSPYAQSPSNPNYSFYQMPPRGYQPPHFNQHFPPQVIPGFSAPAPPYYSPGYMVPQASGYPWQPGQYPPYGSHQAYGQQLNDSKYKQSITPPSFHYAYPFHMPFSLVDSERQVFEGYETRSISITHLTSEQFEAAEHLIGIDKISEFCDANIDADKPGYMKITFKGMRSEAETIKQRIVGVIQEELPVPNKDWSRGTAVAAEAMKGTDEVYIKYQKDKHTMLLFAEDWDSLCKAKKRIEFQLIKKRVSSRTRRKFGGSEAVPVEKTDKIEDIVPGHKTVKGRHLTVKVYKDVITALHLDVVVSAANERLTNSGGVSRAIAARAGHELIKETNHIAKKANISVTELAVTTGGDLPCHKVFHAVGPRWHDYVDKNKCLEDLCYTVLRCLCEARNRGFTSMVFPSISASIFAVPQELCAKMYVRALKSFDQTVDGGSLREVHFVDISDKMVTIIQEELEKTWNQPGGEEDLRKDTAFINKNLGSSEVWALPRMPRKGPQEQITNPECQEDICPICLSPVTDLTRLKCSDVFCKECIERAFREKKVCPVCFADCGTYTTDDQSTARVFPDHLGSKSTVNKPDFALGEDFRKKVRIKAPSSSSQNVDRDEFHISSQVTRDQTEVTVETLWCKTREDNYVIGTLHGQSLTDTDFMSLKGKENITDRVLDTLLEEMKESHPNVFHVFTNSWNNIFDGEYGQPTSGMNHREVQFLKYKKVYGIINPSHKHWIFVGVDIENGQVIYLSSSGSKERDRNSALKNWSIYMRRRFELGLEDRKVVWTCDEIRQDRKKGNRNCGMISYLYAQRFLDGGVYTNLPNLQDMRMVVAMTLLERCEKLKSGSCITCGSEKDTGMVKCGGCGRTSHKKCMPEDERKLEFVCKTCKYQT